MPDTNRAYRVQRGSERLRPLSDTIEAFIKELMAEEAAQQTQVELKRNELAEYFRCAPSQINYVLATRFTPDHGYIIESRRGGGGYIRIIRITPQDGREQHMLLLHQRIGEAISEQQALAVISGMLQQLAITPGQARIMRAAVSGAAIALPINIKDVLRAAILRNMLLAIAQGQGEE